MKPGSYNFTIKAGATFQETWVRSGVGTISGMAVTIDMREGRDPTMPLVFELSTNNGRIVLSTDGTDLTVALHAGADATSPLIAGNYAYDCKLTYGDGTVEYMLEGYVTVETRVTP